MRASSFLSLPLVVVLGCGARSGLELAGDARLSGDAGRDAGIDAPACTPTGPERCNGTDDDCDGAVDEALGIGPLAEPSVVRDRELAGGDCTTCFWAWDPVLAPVDDGFVVYFHLGIYGGRELDNVVRRRLDRDGRPVGALEVLPDLVLLSFDPLSRFPGPTVASTEIRGRRPPIDGVGHVTIDAAGELRVVRSTFPHPGPVAYLDGRVIGVTTRDRRVLHIASHDLDGRDVREREIPFDEVLTAFVGVNEREVGIVVLTYVGSVHQLHFVAVDARAEIVAPPVVLDLPYRSYPRPIGISTGFLILQPGDRDRPIAEAARIDDGGRIVSPFAPLDRLDAPLSNGDQDVIVHHPSRPALLVVHQDPRAAPEAGMRVTWVDEAFDPTSEWRGVAPGYVVRPEALLLGDGRVLVAWHDIAPDSTPNRVFVQPFGCVE